MEDNDSSPLQESIVHRDSKYKEEEETDLVTSKGDPGSSANSAVNIYGGRPISSDEEGDDGDLDNELKDEGIDISEAPYVNNDLSDQSESMHMSSSITSQKQSQSNGSESDRDDLALDVSPSGYSIASLESCITENPHVSQVQDLYVYDNKFTVLPRTLGRLTSLKSLKIFSNEVRLLPDEVGNIIPLEHLQMKVCSSSLGNLPPLGKLSSLKTLELHQTPVRPSVFSFPPGISELQLLKRLAICNFGILFLPPEIGHLKNLEELDVSFNKLKTLPSEVSRLGALKHFRAQNNKLIELPSDLAHLPNLSSIDVAHNKLTSLDSLCLSSMKSLKTLDAKFNKISSKCQIPEWIKCSLEGNHPSGGEVSSSSDVDSPSPEKGNRASLSPHQAKDPVLSNNTIHARKKRLWKRQGIQQLQARQDRLNLSRKARVESTVPTNDVAVSNEGLSLPTGERDGRLSASVDNIDVVASESTLRDSENNDTRVSGISECENTTQSCLVGDHDGSSSKGECHKISIPGVRDGKSIIAKKTEEVEAESGKVFTFRSKEDLNSSLTTYRRKSGSHDKNPKPSKRRRAFQAYTEASLTYHNKSIVGFNQALPDGFYDAGRQHPFCTLETLASQPTCFESREVILVDRDQDEELAAIELSAQNFIKKIELAGRVAGESGTGSLNALQKASMLALFVSDCFGGSDKTLNVANARRGVLGSRQGVPFQCSCSAWNDIETGSSNNYNSLEGNIPTMHMLCEASVRFFKRQRQSNILPIGSLPYGVCRHRAILYKYLCDRASIPCELVRGYLDYAPHAWNIIAFDKGSGTVRMLVDACRPLDVREERDIEYFCRYIPYKRLLLSSLNGRSIDSAESEEVNAIYLEEIGRGASGSIVRKCLMGSVTVAAKVQLVNKSNHLAYKDMLNRFLSELRILCSLGEHPHIVSFYGHQFNTVEDNGNEAVQMSIFMDYVSGCSLEEMLSRYSKEGKSYMPIKQAAYVAQAIVHALCFVHSKGIVHRDIKSSNVLVDFNGRKGEDTPYIKLCDFDSAVPVMSSSSHSCYLAHRGIPSVEVCVGTPRWMAPEVFKAMYTQEAYGMEADIWSFGCLIFEMLTLTVPYAGLPESQIQSCIEMGQRPQLPVEIEDLVSGTSYAEDNICKSALSSDEEIKIAKVLVDLFKACTELCPHHRPTAMEAFKSLSSVLNMEVNDASEAIHASNDNSSKTPEQREEGNCHMDLNTDLQETNQVNEESCTIDNGEGNIGVEGNCHMDLNTDSQDDSTENLKCSTTARIGDSCLQQRLDHVTKDDSTSTKGIKR